MCGNLTGCGYLWAMLSIIVAASTSVGYYYAEWITTQPHLSGRAVSNVTTGTTFCEGKNASELAETSFTFSTFRRCNYWTTEEDENEGTRCYKIVHKCGRYKDFGGDEGIPSAAWQAGAIMGGTGAGLLIMVALVAFFALFIKGIFNKYVAGMCGFFQFLAFGLVAATVIVYPLGFDAKRIQSEACGLGAGQFDLGTCSFGWPFWLSAGSAIAILLVACLSPVARKNDESLYKRGYVI
ncbi:LHFPL tetraspan subfamily member 6 protein-like [Oscarella lobularis]|uniref:LHFPL tetraspan subfamily member 6 protein-like n=1 Tax=Oscarella lobularis TaxID=121494 RepID=UPI0033137C7B